MKKEYVIIGAVALTIGYFVWRNNQKTNGSGGGVTLNTPDKKIITDAGYPLAIDISKVKFEPTIDCFQAPCPQTDSYYGKYLIFYGYDDKYKKDTYTLSNGSSGVISPFYDAKTGDVLGYTTINVGSIISHYL
jgi:hypothetical protein